MFLTKLDTDGRMVSVVQSDPSLAAAKLGSGQGWREISHEQYQAFMAAGCFAKLVDEEVVALPHPPPDLAQARDNATTKIDADAERVRLLFLTPGSGQALEYQKTAEDAARALAVLAATPGAILLAADYPWLGAEQAALAAMGQTVSIADVAQLVAQQQAAWDVAGAAIKETRRLKKMQAAAASSHEELQAVLDGIDWPAPGGGTIPRPGASPPPPPPPPPPPQFTVEPPP